MPRGGRRPGSGRKPKNVLGFPGRPATAAMPAAPPPADVAGLADPPADLSEVRGTGDISPLTPKAVWRVYAPLAIEQRTLVPATVPGFRELCELVVFKEELAARIAKYGTESKRLRDYTRLSQRVDATLARFKLTAFGKPMDGGAAKTPAATNPWAEVGPPAQVGR